MNLEEALNYRRAVRVFDKNKPLDPEKVKHCLELASLAPSSSNMQLWEFFQITRPELIARVAGACLGQPAAATASEIVVFVTRQDLYRQRAQFVLEFERGNIRRNSPGGTPGQTHQGPGIILWKADAVPLCALLRYFGGFPGFAGQGHRPFPPHDARSLGVRYARHGQQILRPRRPDVHDCHGR